MIWHEQDLSQRKEIPVMPNNKKVVLDPAGYFLIRLAHQQIEVGFCNNNHRLLYSFASSSAADLSKTIAAQNLGLSTEHALYLGREMAKAQMALEQGSAYIQD
jgi:hypothetical protein